MCSRLKAKSDCEDFHKWRAEIELLFNSDMTANINLRNQRQRVENPIQSSYNKLYLFPFLITL